MRELSTEETADLQRRVDALVAGWVQQSAPADPPDAHEPSDNVHLRARLARMTAGEQLRLSLAGLVSAAAAEAVRYGAGYPELGAAVGISRQAARKRWPGLPVPARAGRRREWKEPPGGLGWATDSSLGYPGN